MDHTNSRGTKCMHSIAVVSNLKKNIEGSRLLETNETLNEDHRLNVIDSNLEACFEEEFSTWEKIKRGVLDPNKRTNGYNLMNM